MIFGVSGEDIDHYFISAYNSENFCEAVDGSEIVDLQSTGEGYLPIVG